MRSTIAAVLLSLTSVASANDVDSKLRVEQLAPLTVAERYSIESSVLREKRTIRVRKPSGYDFSNERYPLVILLDGEDNMQHVSATTEFLANHGRAMKMIVVGIENTDRQRDFTPPWTNASTEAAAPSGPKGGAREFLRFIADELVPHIDRTFRTQPTRILVGHSYGGLFSVYALLTRPELFKAHIAISPSMWWDHQSLVSQVDVFAAAQKDLRIGVYVTMGNELGPMLGGAQKVVGALASSRSGIEAVFHQWPEESHGSIVMRSVYEGLEWLYELYYEHDPVRAYELGGLQSFNKRFEFISEYVGYSVKIPEQQLMQVYAYLVDAKRWGEARDVTQRVVELYPNNGHVRGELGKTLAELQEKPRAIEELSRALQLYPGRRETREALQKLGVDPQTIVAEHTVERSTLRQHVGTYRYADQTSIVALEGDKLVLNVDRDKRELLARSATHFHAVDSDVEYTFKRGALVVHLPDFEYEAKRVREQR